MTIDGCFSDSQLPLSFAALELTKLPAVKPGDLESISLLERVNRIERRLDNMTDNVHQTYAQAAAASKLPPSHSPVRRSDRRDDATRDLLGLSVKLPDEISCESNAAAAPADDDDGFILPRKQLKAAARRERRDEEDDAFKARPRPKAIFGTKTGTTLRSGPRRHDIFVFRVHRDITDDEIQGFLSGESIVVKELECVSRDDS